MSRIIMIAALSLAFVATAHAAPSAANGKEVFRRVGCYECHNYQGQGGIGPRLSPASISLAALHSYVRNANGNMPPYAPNVLSDEEIADIYAYLQSIPKPPAPDSIPAVKALGQEAR